LYKGAVVGGRAAEEEGRGGAGRGEKVSAGGLTLVEPLHARGRVTAVGKCEGGRGGKCSAVSERGRGKGVSAVR